VKLSSELYTITGISLSGSGIAVYLCITAELTAEGSALTENIQGEYVD
jgi:Na+/proline symporter